MLPVHIWPLRHVFAINEPAEPPLSITVAVDYGFVNYRTFGETRILAEIHNRLLLETDTLDLHRTFLEGECSSSRSGITEWIPGTEGKWRMFIPCPQSSRVRISRLFRQTCMLTFFARRRTEGVTLKVLLDVAWVALL